MMGGDSKKFDNEKIKAIVFDLGNVLLPYNPWRAVFNIARVTRKNPLLVAAYFFTHRKWQLFDEGKLTAEEFFNTVRNDLKLQVEQHEFESAFADMFEENSTVINLLPLLKDRFQLFLLSDINPIHASFCFTRYKFFKIFNDKILSYEVKARKPAFEIYEALQATAGLKPYEMLFIDDRIKNVKGAREHGIHAIHFKGEKRLCRTLHSMGLLSTS